LNEPVLSSIPIKSAVKLTKNFNYSIKSIVLVDFNKKNIFKLQALFVHLILNVLYGVHCIHHPIFPVVLWY
jgi:hypothetical protein